MTRDATRGTRAEFTAASRGLLRRASTMPLTISSDGDDEPSFVSRALPNERMRYVLEERNAELELRLREWGAAKQLYELEFRALEIAARVNVGYVAYLEARQDGLQVQLIQEQQQLAHEGAVRADLLAEIDRLRGEIAQVSAHLHAVRSRRAYRLVDRAVPILRKILFPILAVRRWIRRRLSGHYS